MAEIVSASDRLRNLLYGYQASMAVAVFTGLGFAEQLASVSRTAAELAAAAGCVTEHTERLLEYLVSIEVLEKVDSDCFQLNQVSQSLVRKHADSLADFAMLPSFAWHWNAWGSLLQAVKRGVSGFEQANGCGFFEYLVKDHEASAHFNRLMGSSPDVERAIAEELSLSPGERVLDLGGGRGVLASEIKQRHPEVAVAIFDLPEVEAALRETLAGNGNAYEIRFHPGNFFSDQLPEADTIVLKWVLHDWDDLRAGTILAQCRKSLRKGGRVVVVEYLTDAEGARRSSCMLDLTMMVTTGGKERSFRQYKELFGMAGFSQIRATPLNSRFQLSLIEAT